jgi:hypothetical protein
MWPTNPSKIRMLIMSSETKEKDRPTIRVNRPVLKKWKGEISVEAYALLQKYQAFHQKIENVKPSESEVVDGGLLVAFQKDDAFQKFLGNGGGKPAGLSEQPSS